MNNKVSNFTREEIKQGLKQLPESWQLMFKSMYSHENINLDIDAVVDNMPDEKIDWALTQVENSLSKLKKL